MKSPKNQEKNFNNSVIFSEFLSPMVFTSPEVPPFQVKPKRKVDNVHYDLSGFNSSSVNPVICMI